MLWLVRKSNGGRRSFSIVLLLVAMVFGTGLLTVARSLTVETERADSSNRIALSLGHNLAELDYLFLIGAESETARRYKEITVQSVRNEAAKLEIEVPPEELTASYDPHATEIMQRIKASKGDQTAAVFAFAYHSESGSLAAGGLARSTSSNQRSDAEDGLLRLFMQFHARRALQLARILLPTKEILQESDAVESQLRKLSESDSEGRPEEFKAVQAGLTSLHSAVFYRVYLSSIPPERQVEHPTPPAPPQAEPRPYRLWKHFLAAMIAAYLLYAIGSVCFPQREVLLSGFIVIGIACAITTGFMVRGGVGGIIGAVVGMVISVVIYRLSLLSSFRRQRIARMVSSRRGDDRLWAVSNVALDAEGLALLRHAVVNDPDLRVREEVARVLEDNGCFLELMDILDSAAKDSNLEVGSAARALYLKLGGNLLTAAWREVYSRVQKRNSQRQRTPLTLKAAFTDRRSGTNSWTTDEGVEVVQPYEVTSYSVTVPPICCLCGLWLGTDERAVPITSGEFNDQLRVSLPMKICRLCSHVIDGLKPVTIDRAITKEHGAMVVPFSFLNEKVAELFRLANDGTESTRSQN